MVIKTDMVTTRIMATIIRTRPMTIPTRPMTIRMTTMAMIMARPTSPTPDMTIPMASTTIRTPIMATNIMTTVTTMAMAMPMDRFPKSCA